MSLPPKAASASNICCLKNKHETVFDERKNFCFFKNFYSNLAQNLVSKLPPLPNIFTKSKVASYYDNNCFKDFNFQFSETFSEKILNILKCLNPSKATDID